MNDETFANALRLLKQGAVADVRGLLGPIENEKMTDAKVSHLLGVCDFRESKFEKAEEHFRKAASLDGLFAESRYYIGLCLERNGRPQEARIEYKAVLAIQPNHARALKKLSLDAQAVTAAGGNAVSAAAQPEAAGDAAAQLAEQGLAKGIFTDRKSTFVYVLQWITTIVFTTALVGGVCTFIVSAVTQFSLIGSLAIGLPLGVLFGIANAGGIKKFK